MLGLTLINQAPRGWQHSLAPHTENIQKPATDCLLGEVTLDMPHDTDYMYPIRISAVF